MTLDDIFTQLAHGELSQLVLGNDGSGELGIPKERRLAVASSVSLGLTELHKRFLLREGVLNIQVDPEKRAYLLDPLFAESNTRSKHAKYILDAATPFQDDLMKLERIYDSAGIELAWDEVDNPDAIMTMAYNSIVLPDTLVTESLKIVYRQDHPKFDKTYVKALPSKVPVELPPAFLSALLLFTASRLHTPVGMTSEFHDGNNYAAKFEAACMKLEELNYSLNRDNADTRFELNGWV